MGNKQEGKAEQVFEWSEMACRCYVETVEEDYRRKRDEVSTSWTIGSVRQIVDRIIVRIRQKVRRRNK